MFWLTLLSIGCGGAFGGVLGALQAVDLRRLFELKSWEMTLGRCGNVATSILVGALGGIGGAFAALFVMLIDGKLKAVPTELDYLLLLCVGVLAGFLGFRFLKSIADRFEKAIQAAQEAAQETAEKVTEQKLALTQQDIELKDAINNGLDAARKDSALSHAADAIEQLEEVRVLAPDNRRAAMVLARLHVRLEAVPKAIAVLTDALAQMETRGTITPKNKADILYNRACYLSLLHAKETDAVKKDQYKQNALSDLKDSFALSSENKKEAVEDKDFDSIRNDPEFKRLNNP